MPESINVIRYSLQPPPDSTNDLYLAEASAAACELQVAIERSGEMCNFIVDAQEAKVWAN